MIGNYWNSAYRNLMKRKKFSFINVFGLAIGMASALLILTYVTFEFSFDKMHTKYPHIYRVQSTFREGEVMTDNWASSSFGYGSAMKENLAGIEDYTRIGSLLQPEQIVKYGELTLRENQRNYFYQQLDRLFPGVKAQYQRQGQPYLHKSPRAQALTKAFVQACRARRLAYRMEDIIALTQRSEHACQLSFFSAEEQG